MITCFAVQKGQKSDVMTVLVKLEFGERAIGESAKVECVADQESEVNYTATLTVLSEDAFLIDELASKPLLCMLAFFLLLYACRYMFYLLI